MDFLYKNLEELSKIKSKLVRNLVANKKYRDKNQLFILESLKCIEEAKNKKFEFFVLCENHKNFESNLEFLVNNFPDSEKYILNEKEFNDISPFSTSQGIFAILNYNSLKINVLVEDKAAIALYNIQDPNNLGAILRNAAAFGFQNIILDKCVDITNPKTLRSSMGAVFHLNFSNENIINLKGKYILNGLILDNEAVTLTDFTEKYSNFEKHLFIFGNEGQGLSTEIEALLDNKIIIEQKSFDSLNVSVSTGIVLYELSKKINDK